MKTTVKIIKIVFRILLFPVFFLFHFIAFIRTFIFLTINWFAYGGEFITYEKYFHQKTIADIKIEFKDKKSE